jgi:S1-C subfamily serine protease
MAFEDPHGGEPEPEEPAGPRPHPLDRPWVHPSELRSFVATPASAAPQARPREWVIGITAGLVGAALAVTVLVAFGAVGGRHRNAVPPAVVSGTDSAVDFTTASRVAEDIGPSIVLIRVGGPDSTVLGSGVAATSDRVLTSAKLVAGGQPLTLFTADGRAVTAAVEGVDPETDIAVLKAPNGGLRPATLGPSGDLEVGRPVVVVAAGRANHTWVSIGVVSARNVMTGTGAATVAGMVDTDVKTNDTTLGGVLSDTGGIVVGIMVSPPGATSAGLAMPIGMARDVQDQLDTSGKVAHGWLGVSYLPDLADRPGGGARIGGLAPGGPAAKSGLSAGDVVMKAGDNPIGGLADLLAETRRRHPGDPLTIMFVHDGHLLTGQFKLTAEDPAQTARWAAAGSTGG